MVFGDGTDPEQHVVNPYTHVLTLVEPNGIKGDEITRIRRSFIFPNPPDQRASFNLNSSEQVSATIVFDMAGREVFRTANTSGLDVSGFQNGIYLVEVRTKNGTVYYDRMIVQH